MRGTTENQIKILSKKQKRSFILIFVKTVWISFFLYWLPMYIILAPAKTCRQREEKNCSFS